MSINTPDAIPGVNVNIAGPVQIKSEGLLGTKCEKEFGMQFSGTYEYSDGCMYFCDGKYWQLLNITNPSNVARCGEDSQYKENIAYTFCYLYL
ncbi:MAG: hypothetical protein LBU27_00035, partial [Candidatus Peribacteria bacterium]|nr:hypothetical protein [Candidatus Peribacteria bacterium]